MIGEVKMEMLGVAWFAIYGVAVASAGAFAWWAMNLRAKSESDKPPEETEIPVDGPESFTMPRYMVVGEKAAPRDNWTEGNAFNFIRSDGLSVAAVIVPGLYTASLTEQTLAWKIEGYQGLAEAYNRRHSDFANGAVYWPQAMSPLECLGAVDDRWPNLVIPGEARERVLREMGLRMQAKESKATA